MLEIPPSSICAALLAGDDYGDLYDDVYDDDGCHDVYDDDDDDDDDDTYDIRGGAIKVDGGQLDIAAGGNFVYRDITAVALQHQQYD